MYDSIESLASGFKAQNPEAENWGPNTTYSALVWVNPETRNLVTGSPAPKYSNPDEFLLGYRDANRARFASAPDSVVLDDMRTRFPVLYDAWGYGKKAKENESALVREDEETPEEKRAKEYESMFGQWYGKLPTRPLDEYEAGKPLLELGKKNLKGRAGFFEGLAGQRASDWVPYGEIVTTVGDLASITAIGKRMQSDPESVSDEDTIKFNLFMQRSKRLDEGGWRALAGDITRTSAMLGLETLATCGVGAAVSILGRVSQVGAKAGGKAALKVLGRELREAGADLAKKKVAVKLAQKGVDSTKKKAAGGLADDAASAAASNLAAAQADLAAASARMSALKAADGADTFLGRLAERTWSELADVGMVPTNLTGFSKWLNAHKVGAAGVRQLGQMASEAAAGLPGGALTAGLAGLGAMALPAAFQTGTKTAIEMLASAASGNEPTTSAAARYQLQRMFEGKDEGHAFAAGLGDMFIEYWSEFSGGALMDMMGAGLGKLPLVGGVGRSLAKAGIAERVGAAMVNTLTEAAPKAAAAGVKDKIAATILRVARTGFATETGKLVDTPFMSFMRDAMYDGVFGEWLEERFGGFLRGVTGLQGDDQKSYLANIMEQTMPANSDQAIAELVAFSLPVGVNAGMRQAYRVFENDSMTKNFEDVQKRVVQNLELIQEASRSVEDNLLKTHVEQSAKAFKKTQEEERQAELRDAMAKKLAWLENEKASRDAGNAPAAAPAMAEDAEIVAARSGLAAAEKTLNDAEAAIDAEMERLREAGAPPTSETKTKLEAAAEAARAEIARLNAVLGAAPAATPLTDEALDAEIESAKINLSRFIVPGEGAARADASLKARSERDEKVAAERESAKVKRGAFGRTVESLAGRIGPEYSKFRGLLDGLVESVMRGKFGSIVTNAPAEAVAEELRAEIERRGKDAGLDVTKILERVTPETVAHLSAAYTGAAALRKEADAILRRGAALSAELGAIRGVRGMALSVANSILSHTMGLSIYTAAQSKAAGIGDRTMVGRTFGELAVRTGFVPVLGNELHTLLVDKISGLRDSDESRDERIDQWITEAAARVAAHAMHSARLYNYGSGLSERERRVLKAGLDTLGMTDKTPDDVVGAFRADIAESRGARVSQVTPAAPRGYAPGQGMDPNMQVLVGVLALLRNLSPATIDLDNPATVAAVDAIVAFSAAAKATDARAKLVGSLASKLAQVRGRDAAEPVDVARAQLLFAGVFARATSRRATQELFSSPTDAKVLLSELAAISAAVRDSELEGAQKAADAFLTVFNVFSLHGASLGPVSDTFRTTGEPAPGNLADAIASLYIGEPSQVGWEPGPEVLSIAAASGVDITNRVAVAAFVANAANALRVAEESLAATVAPVVGRTLEVTRNGKYEEATVLEANDYTVKVRFADGTERALARTELDDPSSVRPAPVIRKFVLVPGVRTYVGTRKAIDEMLGGQQSRELAPHIYAREDREESPDDIFMLQEGAVNDPGTGEVRFSILGHGGLAGLAEDTFEIIWRQASPLDDGMDIPAALLPYFKTMLEVLARAAPNKKSAGDFARKYLETALGELEAPAGSEANARGRRSLFEFLIKAAVLYKADHNLVRDHENRPSVFSLAAEVHAAYSALGLSEDAKKTEGSAATSQDQAAFIKIIHDELKKRGLTDALLASLMYRGAVTEWVDLPGAEGARARKQEAASSRLSRKKEPKTYAGAIPSKIPPGSLAVVKNDDGSLRVVKTAAAGAVARSGGIRTVPLEQSIPAPTVTSSGVVAHGGADVGRRVAPLGPTARVAQVEEAGPVRDAVLAYTEAMDARIKFLSETTVKLLDGAEATLYQLLLTRKGRDAVAALGLTGSHESLVQALTNHTGTAPEVVAGYKDVDDALVAAWDALERAVAAANLPFGSPFSAVYGSNMHTDPVVRPDQVVEPYTDPKTSKQRWRVRPGKMFSFVTGYLGKFAGGESVQDVRRRGGADALRLNTALESGEVVGELVAALLSDRSAPIPGNAALTALRDALFEGAPSNAVASVEPVLRDAGDGPGFVTMVDLLITWKDTAGQSRFRHVEIKTRAAPKGANPAATQTNYYWETQPNHKISERDKNILQTYITHKMLTDHGFVGDSYLLNVGVPGGAADAGKLLAANISILNPDRTGASTVTAGDIARSGLSAATVHVSDLLRDQKERALLENMRAAVLALLPQSEAPAATPPPSTPPSTLPSAASIPATAPEAPPSEREAVDARDKAELEALKKAVKEELEKSATAAALARHLADLAATDAAGAARRANPADESLDAAYRAAILKEDASKEEFLKTITENTVADAVEAIPAEYDSLIEDMAAPVRVLGGLRAAAPSAIDKLYMAAYKKKFTDGRTIEFVAPGTGFLNPLHARDGTGLVVKGTYSYLIKQKDGTIYRKARVLVEGGEAREKELTALFAKPAPEAEPSEAEKSPAPAATPPPSTPPSTLQSTPPSTLPTPPPSPGSDDFEGFYDPRLPTKSTTPGPVVAVASAEVTEGSKLVVSGGDEHRLVMEALRRVVGSDDQKTSSKKAGALLAALSVGFAQAVSSKKANKTHVRTFYTAYLEAAKLGSGRQPAGLPGVVAAMAARPVGENPELERAVAELSAPLVSMLMSPFFAQTRKRVGLTETALSLPEAFAAAALALRLHRSPAMMAHGAEYALAGAAKTASDADRAALKKIIDLVGALDKNAALAEELARAAALSRMHEFMGAPAGGLAEVVGAMEAAAPASIADLAQEVTDTYDGDKRAVALAEDNRDQVELLGRLVAGVLPSALATSDTLNYMLSDRDVYDAYAYQANLQALQDLEKQHGADLGAAGYPAHPMAGRVRPLKLEKFENDFLDAAAIAGMSYAQFAKLMHAARERQIQLLEIDMATLELGPARGSAGQSADMYRAFAASLPAVLLAPRTAQDFHNEAAAIELFAKAAIGKSKSGVEMPLGAVFPLLSGYVRAERARAAGQSPAEMAADDKESFDRALAAAPRLVAKAFSIMVDALKLAGVDRTNPEMFGQFVALSDEGTVGNLPASSRAAMGAYAAGMLDAWAKAHEVASVEMKKANVSNEADRYAVGAAAFEAAFDRLGRPRRDERARGRRHRAESLIDAAYAGRYRNAHVGHKTIPTGVAVPPAAEALMRSGAVLDFYRVVSANIGGSDLGAISINDLSEARLKDAMDAIISKARRLDPDDDSSPMVRLVPMLMTDRSALLVLVFREDALNERVAEVVAELTRELASEPAGDLYNQMKRALDVYSGSTSDKLFAAATLMEAESTFGKAALRSLFSNSEYFKRFRQIVSGGRQVPMLNTKELPEGIMRVLAVGSKDQKGFKITWEPEFDIGSSDFIGDDLDGALMLFDDVFSLIASALGEEGVSSLKITNVGYRTLAAGHALGGRAVITHMKPMALNLDEWIETERVRNKHSCGNHAWPNFYSMFAEAFKAAPQFEGVHGVATGAVKVVAEGTDAESKIQRHELPLMWNGKKVATVSFYAREAIVFAETFAQTAYMDKESEEAEDELNKGTIAALAAARPEVAAALGNWRAHQQLADKLLSGADEAARDEADTINAISESLALFDFDAFPQYAELLPAAHPYLENIYRNVRVKKLGRRLTPQMKRAKAVIMGDPYGSTGVTPTIFDEKGNVVSAATFRSNSNKYSGLQGAIRVLRGFRTIAGTERDLSDRALRRRLAAELQLALDISEVPKDTKLTESQIEQMKGLDKYFREEWGGSLSYLKSLAGLRDPRSGQVDASGLAMRLDERTGDILVFPTVGYINRIPTSPYASHDAAWYLGAATMVEGFEMVRAQDGSVKKMKRAVSGRKNISIIHPETARVWGSDVDADTLNMTYMVPPGPWVGEAELHNLPETSDPAELRRRMAWNAYYFSYHLYRAALTQPWVAMEGRGLFANVADHVVIKDWGSLTPAAAGPGEIGEQGKRALHPYYAVLPEVALPLDAVAGRSGGRGPLVLAQDMVAVLLNELPEGGLFKQARAPFKIERGEVDPDAPAAVAGVPLAPLPKQTDAAIAAKSSLLGNSTNVVIDMLKMAFRGRLELESRPYAFAAWVLSSEMEMPPGREAELRGREDPETIAGLRADKTTALHTLQAWSDFWETDPGALLYAEAMEAVDADKSRAARPRMWSGEFGINAALVEAYKKRPGVSGEGMLDKKSSDYRKFMNLTRNVRALFRAGEELSRIASIMKFAVNPAGYSVGKILSALAVRDAMLESAALAKAEKVEGAKPPVDPFTYVDVSRMVESPLFKVNSAAIDKAVAALRQSGVLSNERIFGWFRNELSTGGLSTRAADAVLAAAQSSFLQEALLSRLPAELQAFLTKAADIYRYGHIAGASATENDPAPGYGVNDGGSVDDGLVDGVFPEAQLQVAVEFSALTEQSVGADEESSDEGPAQDETAADFEASKPRRPVGSSAVTLRRFEAQDVAGALNEIMVDSLASQMSIFFQDLFDKALESGVRLSKKKTMLLATALDVVETHWSRMPRLNSIDDSKTRRAYERTEERDASVVMAPAMYPAIRAIGATTSTDETTRRAAELIEVIKQLVDSGKQSSTLEFKNNILQLLVPAPLATARAAGVTKLNEDESNADTYNRVNAFVGERGGRLYVAVQTLGFSMELSGEKILDIMAYLTAGQFGRPAFKHGDPLPYFPREHHESVAAEYQAAIAGLSQDFTEPFMDFVKASVTRRHSRRAPAARVVQALVSGRPLSGEGAAPIASPADSEKMLKRIREQEAAAAAVRLGTPVTRSMSANVADVGGTAGQARLAASMDAAVRARDFVRARLLFDEFVALTEGHRDSAARSYDYNKNAKAQERAAESMLFYANKWLREELMPAEAAEEAEAHRRGREAAAEAFGRIVAGEAPLDEGTPGVVSIDRGIARFDRLADEAGVDARGLSPLAASAAARLYEAGNGKKVEPILFPAIIRAARSTLDGEWAASSRDLYAVFRDLGLTTEYTDAAQNRLSGIAVNRLLDRGASRSMSNYSTILSGLAQSIANVGGAEYFNKVQQLLNNMDHSISILAAAHLDQLDTLFGQGPDRSMVYPQTDVAGHTLRKKRKSGHELSELEQNQAIIARAVVIAEAEGREKTLPYKDETGRVRFAPLVAFGNHGFIHTTLEQIGGSSGAIARKVLDASVYVRRSDPEGSTTFLSKAAAAKEVAAAIRKLSPTETAELLGGVAIANPTARMAVLTTKMFGVLFVNGQAGIPQINRISDKGEVLSPFLTLDFARDYLAKSELFKTLREKGGRTDADLDLAAQAKKLVDFTTRIHEMVSSYAAAIHPGTQRPVGFARGYVRHMFGGSGFEDALHAKWRRIVNQEALVRGERSGAGSRLSAAALEPDLAVKSPADPSQIALFDDLVRELEKLTDTDYADKFRDARKDWGKYDYNFHIHKLATRIEVEIAVNNAKTGQLYELRPDRAALIYGLKNFFRESPDEGRSPVAGARTFASYAEALMASGGEYAPLITDPARLAAQAIRELVDYVVTTSLAGLAVATVDASGLPLMLPGLLPARASEDPKERGRPVLTPIPRWALRRLAEYLSYREGVKLNPGQPLEEQVQRLVTSTKAGAHNQYVSLDHNMAGVDHLYVLKESNASRYLAKLFQRPAKMMYGNPAGYQYDFLHQAAEVNAVLKQMALGWSVFFGTAGLESVTAGTTLSPLGNMGLPLMPWQLHQYKLMWEFGKKVRMNTIEAAETMAELTRSGMRLTEQASTEGAHSALDRVIERVAMRTSDRHGEKAGRVARGVLKHATGRYVSEWLMRDFFGGLKTWAAMNAMDELAYNLPTLTRSQIAAEVANTVNNAFGGQNFTRYAFFTPRMMQLLTLGFFAVNWTVSAWNVAGMGVFTAALLGTRSNNYEAKFIFRNWAAMYLYALMLVPTIMQAAIYGLSRALPDPDDPEELKAMQDDRMLAWNNEHGKGGFFPSIDYTPLARRLRTLFGQEYKGAPTGKRRIYFRFGKQSYEVLDGWLQDPVATAGRKSSMLVKVAWEQLFNHSPGSPDFKLPFDSVGFLAGLAGSDVGFRGSRIATLLSKLLPMSLSSIATNPDAGVLVALVAPASKGMSQTRAIQAAQAALEEAAEHKPVGKFRGRPAQPINKLAVASAEMDAAARNGYDVDTILTSAYGAVAPKYYAKFYEAYLSGDTAALSGAAKALVRLGATTKGLVQSTEGRNKKTGRGKLTDEEKAVLVEAFNNAVPPLLQTLTKE